MKLRPYQEEAVTSTFRYINGGGKSGIMALITAAGKSVVIAEICKRILTKKSHVKIMMLTHVKELIEQNFKRLKAVWPHAPAGIYSAGIKRRQFGLPIIYAGIQSAYKQPALFGKVNLILIDEAHLVSDQDETMYASFIKALKEKNPDLVVIGLTATAYRQGLGCLTRGKIFDDIYFDNTKLEDFVQMIDDGYVSDLIPIDMDSKFDLSNIKMSMGDFQEKSLDENLNRDEITRAIVLETLQHTKDRKKGLAFCISKSHAENMSQRFNEAGLRSTFIHDSVDKGEREDRLIAFDKGEYDIICNVNVLSTGFDQPDLDYIVVARPTQSTSLHVQMLGRGMRIAEGKTDCLVLDFAGNTLRLGPVNDPVLPVPKGEKKGEAPIRICSQCKTINHAAAKECKLCGFVFPPPAVKFSPVIVSTEIIRRKDIPIVIEQAVKDVLVNTFDMSKDRITRLKLTFRMSDDKFIDQYITFEPAMKAAYSDAMKITNQLKFSTTPPVLSNITDAYEFYRHYLIPPDRITVWHNAPLPNKSGKRIKKVLSYKYGDDDVSS
jgi:DNA repair protein RadD